MRQKSTGKHVNSTLKTKDDFSTHIIVIFFKYSHQMPCQGFEFVTAHLSCAENVAKLSSTCDFARGISGRGRRSIFTHEGAQRFDDLISGVNVNRPSWMS